MKRKGCHLKGKKFGRLRVLEDTGKRTPWRAIIWLCRCSCEERNLVEVDSSTLTSGNTRSCGCLVRKHGESKTRLYNIWTNMKTRCYSPSFKYYKYYGGRDITICLPWLCSFLIFKSWAISHGYQSNLTIDRINHKGNYEPLNCQFLTKSENSKKAWRDRKSIKRI